MPVRPQAGWVEVLTLQLCDDAAANTRTTITRNNHHDAAWRPIANVAHLSMVGHPPLLREEF
jgi:hypothetical protein